MASSMFFLSSRVGAPSARNHGFGLGPTTLLARMI